MASTPAKPAPQLSQTAQEFLIAGVASKEWGQEIVDAINLGLDSAIRFRRTNVIGFQPGYFLVALPDGTIGESSGSGGGGNPGGMNQSIQFNDLNNFNGASIFTDGTNLGFTTGGRIHFHNIANPSYVIGVDMGIVNTPHLFSDVFSIVIDDNAGGGFAVGGITGQAFLQIDPAGNAWINGIATAAEIITPTIRGLSGNLNVIANGNFILLNNAGFGCINAAPSGYNVTIGDANFPIRQNGTQIGVSDTTMTAFITAPGGGGRVSIQSGSLIENAVTNSYVIKDNGGVQYLNINIAGGVYDFGNLSTTNYISIDNNVNTVSFGSSGGVILAAGLKGNWPTYADNAAATLASLPVGQIYMADGSGANIQGTLMARY